jgi:hypothetical protein
LKLVVKNNLVDQFKQTWTSMIENASKGDNYKLFKHDVKFEDYLQRILFNQAHVKKFILKIFYIP